MPNLTEMNYAVWNYNTQNGRCDLTTTHLHQANNTRTQNRRLLTYRAVTNDVTERLRNVTYCSYLFSASPRYCGDKGPHYFVYL